jgi:hypothetical protein
VAREGWGHGGEITQALYEHMNNKTKNINKNKNELTHSKKKKRLEFKPQYQNLSIYLSMCTYIHIYLHIYVKKIYIFFIWLSRHYASIFPCLHFLHI